MAKRVAMGGRTLVEDRAGVARFAAIGRRAPWCALGGVTLFAAAFLLHAAPAAALGAPDPLTSGADSGPLVSLFGAGVATSATPVTAAAAASPSQAKPATATAPSLVSRVEATVSAPQVPFVDAAPHVSDVVTTVADSARTAVSQGASAVAPPPVVLPAPVQPHRSQAHRPTVLPVLRSMKAPTSAPASDPPAAAPPAQQVTPPAPRLADPPATPASDGQPATAPVVPAAAAPVDGPAVPTAFTTSTGRHCPAGIPPAPFWVLSITGETPGAGGGTGTAAVPPSSGPVLVPAHSFVWGTPYRAADLGGTRPGHARAPPEERRCPVS